MKTLFSILFGLNLFVTGILGVSLVSVITQSPFKSKDLWLNSGLLLFFAASSYGVNYLKKHNQETLATTILGVIWLSVILITLYAISKARWN